MPLLPASFGFTASSPYGFISVTRSVTLGTSWTEIDVRNAAFSGEADVNAQLVALGLTAADLQVRGVLRSLSVVNLHASQSVYSTEAATPTTTTTNPPEAYATINPGTALTRFHHPRRGLTSSKLRGSGASTTVTYELTLDVIPED